MKSDALIVSAVVLGNFAPAMFHPTWFQKLNLLGSFEIDDALKSEQLIISQAHTAYNVAGFEIQVLTDRFQIATKREDLHEPMRDLLESTLNFLDVVPVMGLGLNWIQNLKAESEEKWHAFGHRFAPKTFWNDHWDEYAGLAALQMQLKRTDGKEGAVNVGITGSAPNGINVKVNDHYELKNEDASKVAKLICEVWAQSKKSGTDLINAIEEDLKS